MTLCEQAEAFRLLLLMGVVDKVDVITWTDSLITASDTVPEWVLDVSLSANEDIWAVEARLRNLPGECNKRIAAYAAAERFSKEFAVNGRFTSSVASHMLAIWAASAMISQEDYNLAMMPSWVADEISFGNATDQEVVETIGNFIARYAPAKTDDQSPL